MCCVMSRCLVIVLAGLAATPASAEDADLSALIYSPWTKSCLKEACFVGRDGHSDPDCGSVVSVVFIERFGDLKKTLHVTLPAGASLERGVRVVIDQGQPIDRPYVGCSANGCMAEYEAGQELVDQFKHGHILALEAVDKANAPIIVTVPLVDFASAYDGPSKEPQVFEESAKKLQSILEERKARCETRR